MHSAQAVRSAVLEVLLQLCHGHLVGLGLRALVAAVVPPPMPPTPPPPAAAGWQLDQQSAAVQDQVLAALLKVTLRPRQVDHPQEQHDISAAFACVQSQLSVHF